MNQSLTLLLVVGNLIAILGGFAAFVGWFRRWLTSQVSEPVADVQRTITDVRDLAQRAHDRLDRHLETHNG